MYTNYSTKYHKLYSVLWQPLIVMTNDQTGSKSLSRISSRKFTRELDKKSPLYCYSIYISYKWSVL